jgi:hypothetical protein
MSLGAIAKLRDINKNSQKRKRFYKDCNMEKVEMNKSMKLSEHFTLGELCKTKYVTEDGNIPSRVHIENLKRICENWLEDLRYSYNMLYVHSGVRPQSKVVAGVRPQSKVAGDCTLAPDPGAAPELGAAPASRKEEPIVINSGYRSPEVNRLAGGATNSNHLTGCAVDIRCAGKEQMIRYASILLDIADGSKQEYDELLLEQHGSVCWLHFAVRPKENRRIIRFLRV